MTLSGAKGSIIILGVHLASLQIEVFWGGVWSRLL